MKSSLSQKALTSLSAQKEITSLTVRQEPAPAPRPGPPDATEPVSRPIEPAAPALCQPAGRPPRPQPGLSLPPAPVTPLAQRHPHAETGGQSGVSPSRVCPTPALPVFSTELAERE